MPVDIDYILGLCIAGVLCVHGAVLLPPAVPPHHPRHVQVSSRLQEREHVKEKKRMFESLFSDEERKIWANSSEKKKKKKIIFLIWAKIKFLTKGEWKGDKDRKIILYLWGWNISGLCLLRLCFMMNFWYSLILPLLYLWNKQLNILPPTFLLDTFKCLMRELRFIKF